MPVFGQTFPDRFPSVHVFQPSRYRRAIVVHGRLATDDRVREVPERRCDTLAAKLSTSHCPLLPENHHSLTGDRFPGR